MGCDIHLYKEKKIDGVWVAADTGWCDKYHEGCDDVPREGRFTDRDYNLFGFLSEGVRCDHTTSFKPRGVPFNVSEKVNDLVKWLGSDVHGHSYLRLGELIEAWDFLQTQTIHVSGMKDTVGLRELQDSINSDGQTDWDLIYPYCQNTNIDDYVEFSLDVPATFGLSGVKKVIDLFDGIDGEDHRIVFWFDN